MRSAARRKSTDKNRGHRFCDGLALKEHGLFADIVPKIYNAGELGKTLAENISEYSAVTICSGRGRIF